MKSKLTNPPGALAVIAALTIATTIATCAQDHSGFAPGRYAPVYGQPGIPQIDPATGLLVPPPPAPPWKDPNWKDPEKVLADVSYDGLPLSEVAHDLRKQFKDAFDVLIPASWQNPYNPAAAIEPGSFPVKMQLKNVTASEVFNAMNLVFEIENTPLRWQLQMNGKRQTAVIRVMPELIAANQLPPPDPAKRTIYFVGDLVGDEKSGGMSIKQLVKTVSDVYQMSYGAPGGVVQFHTETQLLIVTGTVDQINFVQQTLSALREKVKLERKPQPKAAELKINTGAPKSP